jgi:hypothetical protein
VLVASLPHVGPAAACMPALSDSGLGGITAATPFDHDAIARAVPGCTVRRQTAASEGEPVDVLTITDGDTPIALVFPDWNGQIFSVLVQSPSVRNRLGPTIGLRFQTVFGPDSEPVCVPGVEDSSGRVLCPSSPGSRLAYVFDGAWSGPDGTLPSAAELADWRLTALLWRPTPFEDPRWVDVAGFDPGEGPTLARQVREAVDDPPDLARLVLFPITLRTGAGAAEQAVEIHDADAFTAEYARRLTPEFVSAVREEPEGRIHIDDNGAALAAGRIWIAPVCEDDSCLEHRSGIVAVSIF